MSNQPLVTQRMTKTKKSEIKEIVKSMLLEKGITYDDWVAEQEFNYMLDNTVTIKQKFSDKPRGGQS